MKNGSLRAISTWMKHIYSSPPIRISLIYLVVASVWIVVSGIISEIISHNTNIPLKTIEIAKGTGFVLVTFILLYVLIKRSVTHITLQDEKIKRLNRIYSVLSTVNGAILRIRDKNALLDEVCKITTLHGDYQAVRISLLDKTTGEFQIVATGGSIVGDAHEAVHLLTDIPFVPPADYFSVLKEGKSIVFNDLEHGYKSETTASLLTNEIKSYAILPLVVQSDLIGYMFFYSKQPNIFDTGEIRLLEELAADASLGLELIFKGEMFSFYDFLTELPNRILFKDRVQQALLRYGHGLNRTISVIIIDIARFRRITDRFGRHVGDAILKSVASSLKKAVRPGDTVARADSHYLGVLLTDMASRKDVDHVVNKLLDNLPKSIQVNDVNVSLSYSCGIATQSHQAEEAAAIIRHATIALVESKGDGNVIHHYSEKLGTANLRQKIIELGLTNAIELNELKVLYQPIIDTQSLKITACEALLRWNNANLGEITPYEFIPVAEETELIIPIGEWVLEQACKQIIEWRGGEFDSLSISINVSSVQLQSEHFMERITDIIHKYNIDLSNNPIALEITESVLIENLNTIIPVLNKLREKGFHFHIDDFGTGYSSFSYLRMFMVDALKIDRSFIQEITNDNKALMITKGMIGMVKGLGIKVIAEGVETVEQLELLRAAECDYIQGYLISRPINPEGLSGINLG